jgi:hypothetical protein
MLSQQQQDPVFDSDCIQYTEQQITSYQEPAETQSEAHQEENQPTDPQTQTQTKRRAGRPKGSKNKKKTS